MGQKIQQCLNIFQQKHVITVTEPLASSTTFQHLYTPFPLFPIDMQLFLFLFSSFTPFK